MELVEVVQGFKGWFSKPDDTRVRVIVEGSKDNDWLHHHMDIDMYDIPSDITTLQMGYELDIAARLNPDGDLEKIAERPAARVLATPRYDTENRIQRVTSVITEDGRVFYDFNFKDVHDLHQPDNQRARLDHFLRGIKKRYASFSEAYAAIDENRDD